MDFDPQNKEWRNYSEPVMTSTILIFWIEFVTYFRTTKFGFNWPSKNGNKVGVESTHTSWIFSNPMPFKVNEVKENPSDEKKLFEGPISLGFDEKFLQFVPETLEHSSLHFSDDQIASLIPKIGNKIEKKLYF